MFEIRPQTGFSPRRSGEGNARFFLRAVLAAMADSERSIISRCTEVYLGREQNHPVTAIFGTSPTTGVTRCSRCSATRKTIASPKPRFGTVSRTPRDVSRSWRVPPRYTASLTLIEIATFRSFNMSSCQVNASPWRATIWYSRPVKHPIGPHPVTRRIRRNNFGSFIRTLKRLAIGSFVSVRSRPTSYFFSLNAARLR